MDSKNIKEIQCLKRRPQLIIDYETNTDKRLGVFIDQFKEKLFLLRQNPGEFAVINLSRIWHPAALPTMTLKTFFWRTPQTFYDFLADGDVLGLHKETVQKSCCFRKSGQTRSCRFI